MSHLTCAAQLTAPPDQADGLRDLVRNLDPTLLKPADRAIVERNERVLNLLCTVWWEREHSARVHAVIAIGKEFGLRGEDVYDALRNANPSNRREGGSDAL
jgi:hypothetical protein